MQKRYGLSLMVTSEEVLTKYLTEVLSQMSGELSQQKSGTFSSGGCLCRPCKNRSAAEVKC